MSGRSKWLRWLTAGLFLLAIIFVGQGGWIQAKALLAQVLLQQSWQQTLADGQTHKPWPWADHWPVARLLAESHGIDQIVLAGDSGPVLAFAPGYNSVSDMPGSGGTTVISGHRDTHFRFLQQLEPNEQLMLQTTAGRFVYRVVDTRVVDTSDWLLQLVDGADRLVLVTCYPFDALTASGNLRYVVSLQRVKTGKQDKPVATVF